MKIHIIRTDGTQEVVDAPFRRINKLIDCTLTDTVNLHDGRIMLVDDLGYETEMVNHGAGPDDVHRFESKCVKARKPVNATATALYHGVCRPGTTHQIVGDVAIVVDAEVD